MPSILLIQFQNTQTSYMIAVKIHDFKTFNRAFKKYNLLSKNKTYLKFKFEGNEVSKYLILLSKLLIHYSITKTLKSKIEEEEEDMTTVMMTIDAGLRSPTRSSPKPSQKSRRLSPLEEDPIATKL